MGKEKLPELQDKDNSSNSRGKQMKDDIHFIEYALTNDAAWDNLCAAQTDPQMWRCFALFVTKDQATITKYCQHKILCRRVQNIIERISVTEESEHILDKLISCVVKEVQKDRNFLCDDSANFVIQAILRSSQRSCQIILRWCLLGNLFWLAQNQSGSHVVESALMLSALSDRRLICDELLNGYKSSADGSSSGDLLMTHVYGNFVFQAMFKACVEAMDLSSDVFWSDSLNFMADLVLSRERRLETLSCGKEILKHPYFVQYRRVSNYRSHRSGSRRYRNSLSSTF